MNSNMSLDNTLLISGINLNKYSILLDYINSCDTNTIIILDLNGHLLEKSGKPLIRKGYNIIPITLGAFDTGYRWNPLKKAFTDYKKGNMLDCINELELLSKAIMYDEIKINKDPFWDDAAKDYFIALALMIFHNYTDEKQISIKSIFKTAREGAEKTGGSTYFKEYINQIAKDVPEILQYSQTISSAPSETRASIESVFYQKLRVFSIYEEYTSITVNESIDIETLLNEKNAFFISDRSSNKTNGTLIKLLLIQLLNQALSVPADKSISFILEDFLSLGYIERFEKLLTLNTRYGHHFLVDIDCISNATHIYGKHFKNILSSKCSNIYVLKNGDIKTINFLKRILKLFELENTNDFLPLFIDKDKVIQIKSGEKPSIVDIQANPSSELYDINLHKMDPNSFEKTIDFPIKDFVNEARREKLLAMMNQKESEDVSQESTVVSPPSPVTFPRNPDDPIYKDLVSKRQNAEEKAKQENNEVERLQNNLNNMKK